MASTRTDYNKTYEKEAKKITNPQPPKPSADAGTNLYNSLKNAPEPMLKPNVDKNTPMESPKTNGVTNVEFLPDGRVRQTDSAGLQREFTRDEWKTFIGEGGQVTNNVKGARDEQRQNLLQKGLVTPTAQEQAQIDASNAAQTQSQAAQIAGQLDQGPQALQSNVETPNIAAEVLSNVGVKAGVGAAGGAVAGLAGSAGALSLPGAAIGGVGGAIAGVATALPTLKSEYSQATQENYKTLTAGYKTLNAIITDANNKIVPPEVSEMRWKAELRKIDQAEANLRTLAEKDWLTKAKPKLVAFEAFNSGTRQSMTTRLALAIAKPNPANNQNIPSIDLSSEDLLE